MYMFSEMPPRQYMHATATTTMATRCVLNSHEAVVQGDVEATTRVEWAVAVAAAAAAAEGVMEGEGEGDMEEVVDEVDHHLVGLTTECWSQVKHASLLYRCS